MENETKIVGLTIRVEVLIDPINNSVIGTRMIPVVDGKVLTEVGEKPGAGNKNPKKVVRNGSIYKAIGYIKEQLEQKPSGILLKEIEAGASVSSGSAWAAVQNLINEHPGTYEYYKDITVKYHLKGIRMKVVE